MSQSIWRKWRSEEELNGSCKSWIELAYAESCTVTQNTSMHVLKAASGRTQDRKAAPGLALAQAKEPCLGCIQGVHPPRFIETPLCPFKAWSKPWSNSVRPWGGAPSPFYRGSPPPPPQCHCQAGAHTFSSFGTNSYKRGGLHPPGKPDSQRNLQKPCHGLPLCSKVEQILAILSQRVSLWEKVETFFLVGFARARARLW